MVSWGVMQILDQSCRPVTDNKSVEYSDGPVKFLFTPLRDKQSSWASCHVTSPPSLTASNTLMNLMILHLHSWFPNFMRNDMAMVGLSVSLHLSSSGFSGLFLIDTQSSFLGSWRQGLFSWWSWNEEEEPREPQQRNHENLKHENWIWNNRKTLKVYLKERRMSSPWLHCLLSNTFPHLPRMTKPKLQGTSVDMSLSSNQRSWFFLVSGFE